MVHLNFFFEGGGALELESFKAANENFKLESAVQTRSNKGPGNCSHIYPT
jgi:hypothetical protein